MDVGRLEEEDAEDDVEDSEDDVEEGIAEDVEEVGWLVEIEVGVALEISSSVFDVLLVGVSVLEGLTSTVEECASVVEVGFGSESWFIVDVGSGSSFVVDVGFG